jgi:hypothetical protein
MPWSHFVSQFIMVISHHSKSIFVHIQKTGGSSIEEALRKDDPTIESNAHQGRRHMAAREMKTLIAADIWNTYFKFAFVRNPWDRLVSWYMMCVQASSMNNFSRYVEDNAPTFDPDQDYDGQGRAHDAQPADNVTDENGEIIVEFIGRYEALERDFDVVRKKVTLSADLHGRPSTNKDYAASRDACDCAFYG